MPSSRRLKFPFPFFQGHVGPRYLRPSGSMNQPCKVLQGRWTRRLRRHSEAMLKQLSEMGKSLETPSCCGMALRQQLHSVHLPASKARDLHRATDGRGSSNWCNWVEIPNGRMFWGYCKMKLKRGNTVPNLQLGSCPLNFKLFASFHSIS